MRSVRRLCGPALAAAVLGSILFAAPARTSDPEFRLSPAPPLAPANAPSVRLEGALAGILHDWAEGDADAPRRWAEVEAAAYASTIRDNASERRKERAIQCFEAVEHSIFHPLTETAPAIGLLRVELLATTFIEHLLAGRAQLAGFTWPRFEEALERLDVQAVAIDEALELDGPGGGWSARGRLSRTGLAATRLTIALADRLWQLQLSRQEARARELHARAVGSADWLVEMGDDRRGGEVLDVSLYWAGFLARRDGDHDEVLERLGRALDRAPDLHEARLLRALSARSVGRDELARADLERLIEPTVPEWLRRLAWQERVTLASDGARGRGARDEAAKDEVARALDAFPDDRGLRLVGLQRGLLMPPSVVDAGTYLGQELDAESPRASSRLRAETPRREEMEQVLAHHAAHRLSALSRVHEAIERRAQLERAQGRLEFFACALAVDEQAPVEQAPVERAPGDDP